MNQLKNIYQKLAARGVNLEGELPRLELLFKPEKRLNKDGTESKIQKRTVEEIILNFWLGVNILNETECWEWMRSVAVNTNRNLPYGKTQIGGKDYRSHRLSFIMTKGDTKGKLVCHKCDNAKCCNPHHLFLGTHMDNSMDKINKGRDRYESGEDRYNAKLNLLAVEDIRKNYIPHVRTISHFAKKYGVYKSVIEKVIYNKTWINK